MLLDCEKCMNELPAETRAYMGCGYLAEARQPAGRPSGYDGELTVCVGYSTKLPEVIEVSRARLWWDKGQLTVWCHGEGPTQSLCDAIIELESAAHAAQAHAVRKGGS